MAADTTSPGLFRVLWRALFVSTLVIVGLTMAAPAVAGRVSGICSGEGRMVRSGPGGASMRLVCKGPEGAVEYKLAPLLLQMTLDTAFGGLTLLAAGALALRPVRRREGAASPQRPSKQDRSSSATARPAAPRAAAQKTRVDPRLSTPDDLDAVVTAEVLERLRAGEPNVAIRRVSNALDCGRDTAAKIVEKIAKTHGYSVSGDRAGENAARSAQTKSLSHRQVERVRLLSVLQARVASPGQSLVGALAARGGLAGPATDAWSGPVFEPPSWAAPTVASAATAPTLSWSAPGGALSGVPGATATATPGFGGALGGAFTSGGAAVPGVTPSTASTDALPADRDAAMRTLREWLVSGRLTFAEYEKRRDEVQARTSSSGAVE